MSKPKLRKASRAEEALYTIAMMGYGMKDDVRDWAAIGRNAVYKAREHLAGKCKCCGRHQEFKPRAVKDL